MPGMGVPARVAQPPLRVAIIVAHHPVRVVAFGRGLEWVALWSVELLSVQDGVVGHGLVPVFSLARGSI